MTGTLAARALRSRSAMTGTTFGALRRSARPSPPSSEANMSRTISAVTSRRVRGSEGSWIGDVDKWDDRLRREDVADATPPPATDQGQTVDRVSRKMSA